MALTVALVRQAIPKERTGSAMGLLGTMSAIGTALGPSLGGVLIAGPGWRAIFLVMLPVGILNLFISFYYLPIDQKKVKACLSDFDILGTLLLGLTLAAYALAVTVGGQYFNEFNIVLLLVAVIGGVSFVLVEAKVVTPLIQLTLFRNVKLSASLTTNVLVSTVMMTTLVVGPFYLSIALGLNEVLVGIVMSIGPIVSALSGIPAGRLVDRLGAPVIIIVGLITMIVGSLFLSVLPAMYGILGYVIAISILTPGYQLFQAANNTAVMMDVHPKQRGIISGMLSLSRNLGLITGASVMGALFAFASLTIDTTTSNPLNPLNPGTIEAGMRLTFSAAAFMTVIALGLMLLAVKSEMFMFNKK